MVRVKVCGLTNAPDLRLALELGADFAGFVFYRQSPRSVTPKAVREIVRQAGAESRAKARRVGVFVNEDARVIRRVFEECGLDLIQLHGDETPEYCRGLNLPYWKAIRIRSEASLRDLKRFGGQAVLLDAYSQNAFGGTGKPFPLSLARAAAASGRRIVLAGGLSTGNLNDILTVRPWALDVSSSLEEKPGKKSELKMRAFFRVLNEIRGRS